MNGYCRLFQEYIKVRTHYVSMCELITYMENEYLENRITEGELRKWLTLAGYNKKAIDVIIESLKLKKEWK